MVNQEAKFNPIQNHHTTWMSCSPFLLLTSCGSEHHIFICLLWGVPCAPLQTLAQLQHGALHHQKLWAWTDCNICFFRCFYTDEIESFCKAHIQTTSTCSRPLPDGISLRALHVNIGYIPHPLSHAVSRGVVPAHLWIIFLAFTHVVSDAPSEFQCTTAAGTR